MSINSRLIKAQPATPQRSLRIDTHVSDLTPLNSKATPILAKPRPFMITPTFGPDHFISACYGPATTSI